MISVTTRGLTVHHSSVRFAVTATIIALATSAGCAAKDVELVPSSGGDADGGAVFDAGPTVIGGDCEPGSSVQCNDCLDNDNDGLVDGFDPECTGAADDDEGSFSTGIPGDNNRVGDQDCAYDGNSGFGEGCRVHACCILDLSAFGGACPDGLDPGDYDANDCEASPECAQNCEPLTPPGCDCFACCTICVDGTCTDVMTNPAVAPDCDQASIEDASACPRCEKTTSCETACGDCTPCPGQTTLPPQCGGQAVCPSGLTCEDGTGCGDSGYCSNGCCIQIVE